MPERPDFARFTGHCRAIHQALLRGPQTNRQLAAISLKYTGRISDLRARGVAIECRDLGGGLTEYRLGGTIAEAGPQPSAAGVPAPRTEPGGGHFPGAKGSAVVSPSSQQHELFSPQALKSW